MSELREAAQAVINRWYRLPGDNDRAILSDLFARLRAALAQPETAEPPRDEWRLASEPPTESTIAAKCQRIEGSGEICGLTPPCPDCGSSLIDVAEGAK